MRILFTAHHRLIPGTGVANATWGLADALRTLGHHVEVFGHAEAFGARDPRFAKLRLPHRVAREIRRAADRVDVVDAMTGDAWWYLQRRTRRAPIVVARAHGLEHLADAARRAHARQAGTRIRWRYRAYTGGFRLWEVRQSIERADGVVTLNTGDAAYVRSRMRVDPARVFCIPNGLAEPFLTQPAPDRASSQAWPLRIVFIGSWIPLKGISVVTATLNALAARGVDYRADLLGTGDTSPDVILAPLTAGARARTRVVARYAADALPAALAGAHVLLHPSWTEGFCIALVEAMACGLAPVVTPAGAAYDLVRQGESGIRVDADPADCAGEVAAMAGDRDALHTMRVGAHAAVRALSWRAIAERTVAFYRSLGAPP